MVDSSSSEAPHAEIEGAPTSNDEAHKKAYKLLVLQREIRYAKAELSKRQAALKNSLAQKRRFALHSVSQTTASSPSVEISIEGRNQTTKYHPSFSSARASRSGDVSDKGSAEKQLTILGLNNRS